MARIGVYCMAKDGCGRPLQLDFVTSYTKRSVFKCDTAGVPIYRINERTHKVHRVGSTADHSDRWFVQERDGSLVRVKPVSMGKVDLKDWAKKIGRNIPGERNEVWELWEFEPVREVA